MTAKLQIEQTVTKRELASIFGVTPRTVNRWMAAGLHPIWTDPSGCRRFLVSETARWRAL